MSSLFQIGFWNEEERNQKEGLLSVWLAEMWPMESWQDIIACSRARARVFGSSVDSAAEC